MYVKLVRIMRSTVKRSFDNLQHSNLPLTAQHKLHIRINKYVYVYMCTYLLFMYINCWWMEKFDNHCLQKPTSCDDVLYEICITIFGHEISLARDGTWCFFLLEPVFYLSVTNECKKVFSSYDLTRFIDRFCVMLRICRYNVWEIFNLHFYFYFYPWQNILYVSMWNKMHYLKTKGYYIERKKRNWSFNLSYTSVCTRETQ